MFAPKSYHIGIEVGALKSSESEEYGHKTYRKVFKGKLTETGQLLFFRDSFVYREKRIISYKVL